MKNLDIPKIKYELTKKKKLSGKTKKPAEEIMISKDYFSFVGVRFKFALCDGFIENTFTIY